MPSRLKADHDDLRLLIQDFLHLLSNGGQERLPELVRLRTNFSKRFRQHLATEDADLRARPTADHPALKAACEMHGQKQRGFFLSYSDHIKGWTPERIANDWEGYRASVILLARDHRQLMDWEERELHPLLEAQKH